VNRNCDNLQNWKRFLFQVSLAGCSPPTLQALHWLAQEKPPTMDHTSKGKTLNTTKNEKCHLRKSGRQIYSVWKRPPAAPRRLSGSSGKAIQVVVFVVSKIDRRA
jgi:hypothetical protein